MRSLSSLWKKIDSFYKSLRNEDIQKMVLKAMEKPEHIRARSYSSNGFKTKAMNYYAQWVALDTVFEGYLVNVKITQRKLYAWKIPQQRRQKFVSIGW